MEAVGKYTDVRCPRCFRNQNSKFVEANKKTEGVIYICENKMCQQTFTLEIHYQTKVWEDSDD